MGKKGGGVDFGFLTFILIRDEVQSVLSTPCKLFFIYWVLTFWALGEIWQNLDFSQISLLVFYVWNIV